MRYHALACDYDGTIARDGRVDPETLAALERLAASGRRLILVTGRQLEDLQRVFDRLDLFDRVVAENGGVLFEPATREERLLTTPPDPRFVEHLEREGVKPLSVGRTIVATWEPNHVVVLEAIRDLGLELEIIFNKGAVMVLPIGITKASGLHAAVKDLRLSLHNVVGVGDAQNDHAFLISCELAGAVSNALDAVKDDADLVLRADHGAGVAELIDRILADDLASVEPKVVRYRVGLGPDDQPFVGPATPRDRLLLTGTSGGGKSTLVTAFVERLADRGYQFCLVDPEGDYEHLSQPVTFGRAKRAPTVDEVITTLEDPDRSVVADLLAVPMPERPAFFDELLAGLLALRVRTGRPHWIIVDEAHHLLPAGWQPKAGGLEELIGLLFVTVHPDRLSPSIARSLDAVVTVGEDPFEELEATAKALGRPGPRRVESAARGGAAKALFWALDASDRNDSSLVAFTPAQPRGERKRHRRKYATGELSPDKSFWFRGPDGRLNLRAQNLALFLQVADGVDDATWLHHLQAGDYSRWIRDSIKDEPLAEEIAAVEEDKGADADASKKRVREAIEEHYAIEEAYPTTQGSPSTG